MGLPGWQRAYWARQGRRRTVADLLPAPPEQPESAALADLRAAIRARDERTRERDREHEQEVRELVAAHGEAELVERWRADVERFGSKAVETIRRRVDPTFRLPASLQGIKGGKA